MAKRKDVMLALPLDVRRLEHWPKPFIAQPKVEGLRNRAILKRWPGGIQCELLSSSAAEVISVPHINKQLADHMRRDIFTGDTVELDGELYIHGVPFSGPSNSISSIGRRTVNRHPEYEKMEYHIFDIINENVQIDRTFHLKILSQAFKDSIKHVDHVLLKDSNDVARYLADCMAEGYEGIILRHPQASYQRKRVSSLMKFKPRNQDAYRIVGVNEEISKDGHPKGTLGAFICEKNGQRFQVGSGPVLTKLGRQEMWNYRNVITNGEHVAVVKYQYLTIGRDVPYSPVVIEVIHKDDYLEKEEVDNEN